jgi:hypothetical protein
MGKAERARTRRLGQYFTPPPLAALLAARTLSPSRRHSGRKRLRICDPACGEGALLLAAGQWLAEHTGRSPRRIAAEVLHGIELDAAVARRARRRVARWGGIPPSQVHVRTGDALRRPPAERFDVVLANPPYVRVHRQGAALRAWLRGCGRFDCLAGDFDLYVAFMELAVSLLRAGGRMGLITSGKYLARRYGDRLRAFLADRAPVAEVWDVSAAGRRFGASTYPVLTIARRAGKPTAIRVMRTDADLQPTPLADVSQAAFVRGHLLAEALTPPALRSLMGRLAALPRLGGLAGVRIFCGTPRARDYRAWGRLLGERRVAGGLPFVTCGSIRPGAIDRGRPVRAFGRTWRRPWLRRGAPISDGRWADFVIAPKVLVRGNARRLTAAVDRRGCAFVGVYAICGGPWSPDALAALLNSDVLGCWASLHGRQMAVAGGHITFNAPLLAALPLPRHTARLDRALGRGGAPNAFGLSKAEATAVAALLERIDPRRIPAGRLDPPRPHAMIGPIP